MDANGREETLDGRRRGEEEHVVRRIEQSPRDCVGARRAVLGREPSPPDSRHRALGQQADYRHRRDPDWQIKSNVELI